MFYGVKTLVLESSVPIQGARIYNKQNYQSNLYEVMPRRFDLETVKCNLKQSAICWNQRGHSCFYWKISFKFEIDCLNVYKLVDSFLGKTTTNQHFLWLWIRGFSRCFLAALALSSLFVFFVWLPTSFSIPSVLFWAPSSNLASLKEKMLAGPNDIFKSLSSTQTCFLTTLRSPLCHQGHFDWISTFCLSIYCLKVSSVVDCLSNCRLEDF